MAYPNDSVDSNSTTAQQAQAMQAAKQQLHAVGDMRMEAERRALALSLANTFCEGPTDTVSRADAYLAFLKG